LLTETILSNNNNNFNVIHHITNLTGSSVAINNDKIISAHKPDCIKQKEQIGPITETSARAYFKNNIKKISGKERSHAHLEFLSHLFSDIKM
jgi:hypothetical protein